MSTISYTPFGSRGKPPYSSRPVLQKFSTSKNSPEWCGHSAKAVDIHVRGCVTTAPLWLPIRWHHSVYLHSGHLLGFHCQAVEPIVRIYCNCREHCMLSAIRVSFPRRLMPKCISCTVPRTVLYHSACCSPPHLNSSTASLFWEAFDVHANSDRDSFIA